MEFRSYEPVPPNVQQTIVELDRSRARASRRSETSRRDVESLVRRSRFAEPEQAMLFALLLG